MIHVRRVVQGESGNVIYFGDVTYRGNFVKLHIDLIHDGRICRPI